MLIPVFEQVKANDTTIGDRDLAIICIEKRKGLGEKNRLSYGEEINFNIVQIL